MCFTITLFFKKDKVNDYLEYIVGNSSLSYIKELTYFFIHDAPFTSILTNFKIPSLTRIIFLVTFIENDKIKRRVIK